PPDAASERFACAVLCAPPRRRARAPPAPCAEPPRVVRTAPVSTDVTANAAEAAGPEAAEAPQLPSRILLVTDAWEPQVNGVVRTLSNTMRELRDMGCEIEVISPADYKRTVPLRSEEHTSELQS